MALQYGVPISALSNKFAHMRFEPSGFTGNAEIPIAKSLMDYIFRWLDLRFGEAAKKKSAAALDSNNTDAASNVNEPIVDANVSDDAKLENAVFTSQADAPPCHSCGSIMVRSGSCYKCFNCGCTSGCS